MTDFLENFNEGIEDNAGLLGAAGGLAALKGQQAQRKKLSDIEAQLQRAENRVEKEAQLKRKLIALEEIIDEALESESKLPYFLQFKKGFTDVLGKPSESLTSLDDIKYARDLEKKATQLDKFFPTYSKFLNATKEKCKTIRKQLRLKYNIDHAFSFDGYDEFLADYRTFLYSEIDRLKSEFEYLAEELGVAVSQEDVIVLCNEIGGLPSEVMSLMKFFLGGMHQSKACDLPVRFGSAYSLRFTRNAQRMITSDTYFSKASSLFQSEHSVHTNEMTFTSFDSLKESLDKSTYFSRCFSSDQFFDRVNHFNKNKAGNKDSGCFIATAVYGDYDHPQVLKLRHFRDSTLRKTLLGRCFISFYYSVGPHLAILPSRSVKDRSLLRALFDRL